MRIHLIAVGTRMPGWVETAYADYAARLPHECRLELTEIAPAQRSKNTDIARAKQQEGERILKALPRDCLVIALDERGRALSSVDWSAQLQAWMQSGRDTCLLVGGADGLAPEVLAC
ncbi:MAG: 23S rRNA (pseudouridine(1915)-N(3))-methyltransferase RlmH, partial [Gammaproteobacteria bacterium]